MLYPLGKDSSTHWTGGGGEGDLVWMHRLEEKSFASVRNQSLIIQYIVKHYTE
jgi:hypothetical protein